jgi:hypothetical protein
MFLRTSNEKLELEERSGPLIKREFYFGPTEMEKMSNLAQIIPSPI